MKKKVYLFKPFRMLPFLINYWINLNHTRRLLIHQSNFVGDYRLAFKVEVEIFDFHGVGLKYSVTDDNILNLAGGFPTVELHDASFIAESENDSVLNTKMFLNFGFDEHGNFLLGRIERNIDFEQRKINNIAMIFDTKGKGLGTNVILNQIIEATALSFQSIELTAAGGIDYPVDSGWDGYRVWAKYGFMMTHEYQEKYTDWARRRRLKEKNLNELYLKGTNYHLWENEGFSWDGVFDLGKSSASMRYLKYYLAAKHINKRI